MAGEAGARSAENAETRKNHPEVRNVDDLWAWMNTWGDLLQRHEGGRSKDWRQGYEQAIDDLFVRLGEMGVENCSDEAWQRFTGRG